MDMGMTDRQAQIAKNGQVCDRHANTYKYTYAHTWPKMDRDVPGRQAHANSHKQREGEREKEEERVRELG